MTIDRLLQRCTVRLDVQNTGSKGSGFLVAAGWILSCEHVVREATGSIQVTGSNGEDLGSAMVNQVVPESDLALLAFTPPSKVEVAVVCLDRSFQPLDNFYIYGYPSDFPNGASVTAECEGCAEDEGLSLIKFKAGQFQPGISGSPVLNLRSGKVCGVVKFTRDRSSDLGGGAIQVDTVFAAFPWLATLQKALPHSDWSQAWTAWKTPPRGISLRQSIVEWFEENASDEQKLTVKEQSDYLRPKKSDVIRNGQEVVISVDMPFDGYLILLNFRAKEEEEVYYCLSPSCYSSKTQLESGLNYLPGKQSNSKLMMVDPGEEKLVAICLRNYWLPPHKTNEEVYQSVAEFNNSDLQCLINYLENLSKEVWVVMTCSFWIV